jgi:hypothetical protein
MYMLAFVTRNRACNDYSVFGMIITCNYKHSLQIYTMHSKPPPPILLSWHNHCLVVACSRAILFAPSVLSGCSPQWLTVDSGPVSHILSCFGKWPWFFYSLMFLEIYLLAISPEMAEPTQWQHVRYPALPCSFVGNRGLLDCLNPSLQVVPV